MIDQILSIAKNVKEREVPPLLKRTLNIIFLSGITSFIFKSFYFDYKLIDFLDYRAYFDFFINGDFIVPAGIYFIVWATTYFLSYVLFRVPNFFLSSKIRTAVINFSFQEVFPKQSVDQLKGQIVKYQSLEEKEALVQLFEKILKSLSKTDMIRIRKNTERMKDNIEESIRVLIRGVIAVTLYFINVSFFGWILFIMLILVSILIVFILFLGYQIAEIFPIVLFKAYDELSSYVEQMKQKVKKEEEITISLD